MQDVHVKLNPGLPWQKQHSTRKRLFSQQIGLKFKEETSKMLHLEYSFVWCWNFNTMESRSETRGKFWNVVLERNGEDHLDQSHEKRSVTKRRRKSNWIDHIFCRNCLLNHFIEGKIEEGMGMTGRRGRRHKQLLDDLKETRRYWEMKEEVLDCAVWRTHFGRGYGSVVRQTAEWVKEWMNICPLYVSTAWG